ncbi:hypothetical protein M758_4G273900 [Ceratodon purpureus]|uniref:Apple domain-containing protein n=1 Tax=Ceratodon purpureus TaxID=3225 RepID=A0A8T0IFK1_CERPU|nr:hypothetical protein KC19_4G270600 [Ceratodon purpureus]KAG0621160.1 hypothetical protein M758_4G273900 [Ceratodon purpureus]
MAHLLADFTGRFRGCSYKRATFVLCTGNVMMALFMLHAILAPICSDSSPPQRAHGVLSDGLTVAPTKEEWQRIEDSNRLRLKLLPTLLIERVNEIRLETEEEIERTEALNLEKLNVAAKLAERLRELKLGNSQSTLQDDEQIAAYLGVSADDLQLGSQQNAGLEDDTIPGREIPPECHAEVHTDYGGAAVRWGLTHHVGSAADCCQACLDHAKNATAEEKKCNIWVYCPSEGGCHSPDKYTHENHECWLKQADEPVLNFKDHYSEEYRQQHPAAPSVVPWISGVVS